MLTTLTAAVFYIRDMAKAKNFYINVLGFEIVRDDGEYVTLKLGKNQGSLLALNSQHREFQVPGKQTISVSSDDVEKDYENLKKLGINIFDELTTYSWGKYFSFEDIDGNHIDVVQR